MPESKELLKTKTANYVVCQNGRAANIKSSQWPKVEQSEQENNLCSTGTRHGATYLSRAS